MANSRFHRKPYEEGTLRKLKIFEYYIREWIPVFVSREQPRFSEVHIFDYFCGPGTDSNGIYGSPLRILDQLRRYQRLGMAGWSKVKIFAHLSDSVKWKIEELNRTIETSEWKIPGVEVDIKRLKFKEALGIHESILLNPRAAKLLIIDQFGVDEVSDTVFEDLIRYPVTDFIFFLSSSTLHRFHDHPSIKIKIEKPENSYDVHRAAFDYFRKIAPPNVFLGRFSIQKRSNIYGLIFGSQHPLGIHKFLQVAWGDDEIYGEANFDIERENIVPGEMLLPLQELRPKKIQVFEVELEADIRAGRIRSEADMISFCIGNGMTGKHCTSTIKKLKTEKIIYCSFRTPSVNNFKSPREINLR